MTKSKNKKQSQKPIPDNSIEQQLQIIAARNLRIKLENSGDGWHCELCADDGSNYMAVAGGPLADLIADTLAEYDRVLAAVLAGANYSEVRSGVKS